MGLRGQIDPLQIRGQWGFQCLTFWLCCWGSGCSPSPSPISQPASTFERDGEIAMTFDYLLGGIVSIGLIVYLVYALLRPEHF
jgi:K+-transporting ATPase KdpF subunit